jgi:hypothetical protein
MTLGSDLLTELDLRAKGGLPFHFKTRQELRRLDSWDKLSEFLQSRGIGDVPKGAEGVADLADYVCAVWATRGWRATRRTGMIQIVFGVLVAIGGWNSSGASGVAALTLGGLLILLGLVRLLVLPWIPRRFGRHPVPL